MRSKFQHLKACQTLRNQYMIRRQPRPNQPPMLPKKQQKKLNKRRLQLSHNQKLKKLK